MKGCLEMAIITDIQPQKKNKSRFNIYIDGVFVTGASGFAIRKNGLSIGKEIEKEKLQNVIFEDEVEKAKGYIIDYHLNKSKKIIIDKLKGKEYSEKVIEKVMEFIENYNVVDDKEYARKKALDMVKIGKKGKRVIAQTLRVNGISEEDIEEALVNLNKEDEVVSAKKVLKGKIESYKRKSENIYELKNKCFSLLMRRGFETEIINIVLEEENLEE